MDMTESDHTAAFLGTAPRVSVIMATYNGAPFIRQSISSLLAQSFSQFELIVVDDCSTDETPAILRSIADPRLRVLRNATNLGVVESRNRCFACVTGDYVAMLDHDDLSRPTRLAQQVAYLDSHPDTVLIATAAHHLKDGRITPPRLPGPTSPALIAWLLLVANPLVCSSVMFRAAAARRLPVFMREIYAYADDYDLYVRLKPFGAIARIDEPLTLYRLHQTNTYRTHEDVMIANATRVLTPQYVPYFGEAAGTAADLVVLHLAACRAVMSPAALRELRGFFLHLTDNFIAREQPAEADIAAIHAEADEMWQRTVRLAARFGRFTPAADDQRLYGVPAFAPRTVALGLLDRLPFHQSARGMAKGLLARAPAPAPPARSRKKLHGVDVEPVAPDSAQPPTLFVVVDTEAEFDWTRPFDRGLTSVHAIEHVERGQAVFDHYALRPIYVVDYPIATEPRSVAKLRAIRDRGACEIGAHLHPWTTPPFVEEVSSQNSYPGNLPPWLEREKLLRLVEAIETNFGEKPLFYKAGRYGFGPETASALVAAGIKVDLSVLPGTDLRRKGGPDFRALEPHPYRLAGEDLVTVPMTRSAVGLLPALGRLTEQAHHLPVLRHIPLQAALARTRLADTITLTPEGVTAEEQIRLIRALLKRGTSQFVLHYHSPSLQAGNTSYTRTEADVVAFVARLQTVCRFFFEEIGGMPGFPRDLIPV